MSEEVEVTPSSGNVFADLGLPDPGALLERADAILRGMREMALLECPEGGKHQPQSRFVDDTVCKKCGMGYG